MPYPVCGKCVSWKFLCVECEKKYADGILNIHEVEVSRLLYSLAGDALSLKHVVSTKDEVVLVVAAEDVGKAIGASGRNIRKLSAVFQKPVKVVGDGDLKDVCEAIIAPAPVKSINKAFGQNGETVKVHIAKEDISRLRHTPDDIQKLLSSITDKPSELVFD